MNNILTNNLKNNNLICAIDIGTSSIRISAFDTSGKAIKDLFIQTFYQMNIDKEGRVEIEVEKLLAIVVESLDIFLSKLKENHCSILGVGISTIWHSILAIDSKTNPLTPLISWNDTRSSIFAQKLKESFDEAEIHQISGCRFHASYWPAKISWLLDKKPFLKKQVKYWLSFGDYLFLKLFGEIATSISLASATGLFNRYNLDWNKNFIEKLSLDIKHFPIIAQKPFSKLQSDFSKRWPLLENIPWFLPVGDGACSNIGSNSLDNSSFALMIGTSGAMRLVSPQISLPEKKAFFPSLPFGLWSYSIDLKRQITGGAISNAGNLFAWLKDTLNLPQEASNQNLEEELRKIKADSHKLIILPFLSGERSLGWHDNAKAAILGLQLSTTPTEILRAGLETIAYQFLSIYQELEKFSGTPKKVIATGGGLYNSELWGEIIADVLGKELYLSPYSEASSRGTALLVLENLNVTNLTPQNDFEKVYQPNLENTKIYKQAFERYQKYYTKLISDNF